ncbi:MAG TPA: hypothetical protein VGK84_07130 [Candidatus Tumulicola sp.]|jgi:hypothetical protein
MRTISPPITRLSGAIAAIALLSACSGGMQSQVAPSTGTSAAVTSNALTKGGLSPFAYRGLMPAAAPNHRPSWMSPNAKKKAGNALLYVSNFGTADVTVYTYNMIGQNVALSGMLTGFTKPGVPCADVNGNVFIPDYGAAKIYEYAHGATSPTQVLSDTTGSPVSCSVDPSTGNLAVANFGPTTVNGNVAIFPQATGTPNTIMAANVAHPAFVGYLPTGALYVDGQDTTGGFQIAEMPSGGSSFSAVAISGATLYSPGSIQWGGSYLLIGDQMYQNQQTSAVYQMCVCSTGNLKFAGVAPIVGSTDVVSFFKRGGGTSARIIAPDFGNSANGVIIYNPSAQQMANNVTDGVSEPIGAAISQKGKM